MITDLKRNALKAWQNTSVDFLESKEEITDAEKRKNEDTINSFRSELAAVITRIPTRFANHKKWKKKILDKVGSLET